MNDEWMDCSFYCLSSIMPDTNETMLGIWQIFYSGENTSVQGKFGSHLYHTIRFTARFYQQTCLKVVLHRSHGYFLGVKLRLLN